MLARVIVDSDPVALTAHSITVLIEILTSPNEDAVIVAGMQHFIGHFVSG